MPANRNALIRYKTIDNCLKNRFRKWTLEDIIEKVAETLYEYEGIEAISKRTIQNDIQMMRSDKLGYFAPIVVLDKKYYTYEDPNYSITSIPISETDLARMNEAVEMLKQFKGFSHFEQLNEVVQKLEDHVYANVKKENPVIDFEKNENLKGLSHLDNIYKAIIQKKALMVSYQSFKAKEESTFCFHVWWLKEFKNRWFAVGVRKEEGMILNLALDRMRTLAMTDQEVYIENKDIDAKAFYNDTIGVSTSPNMRPENIHIFVNRLHAPYVETKPLHHSQTVIDRRENGIVIVLKVIHNFELEREILGFGDGMTVLKPAKFQRIIKQRLALATKYYAQEEAKEMLND
jgi:predicted DNA-binding transcriptional regulator YafY